MENREVGERTPNGSGSGAGRVVIRLAELPGQTLLDERALAASLGVTMRTIRRMVRRNELPPPVSFAGRSTWMASNVLSHFERRAERAARDAEREDQRLAALSAGMTQTRSRSNRKVEEGKRLPAVESASGNEKRPIENTQ